MTNPNLEAAKMLQAAAEGSLAGHDNGAGAGADPFDDTLPEIIVNNRQLRTITDSGLAALIDANTPPTMFVRRGAPVRVRFDEDQRPLIDDITPVVMRHFLSRTANWRGVKQDGNTRDVLPPKEVAEDIIAGGTWSFPRLEGLSESPVLRHDGSILTEPGYDPATSLFYAPEASFLMPPVPATPNTTDLHHATTTILDILDDFPFVDGADLANAVGLILTPVIRPIIDGLVPMAVVTSPTPGTGKGLLVDAVAEIATGRPAPKSPAPVREEELQKAVIAILRGGRQLCVFDNVEGRFSSSTLAALLTSNPYAGRVLGRSEDIELPNRTVWIATGNNLQPGGDLPRRTYKIGLDAKQAQPWTRRGFRHEPLLPHIHAHRGSFLAALLTMARAWLLADRPKPTELPTIGSYEAWAEAVGGILTHAGVPGFLSNVDTWWRETDTEATQWEAFLYTWHATLGADFCFMSEVASQLEEPNSKLRAALPDTVAAAFDRAKQADGRRRSLGIHLRKHVDRRYGVHHIETDMDTHSKTILWRVRSEQ